MYEHEFRSGLTLIIGMPRTGKTTLINEIIEQLDKESYCKVKHNEFDGDIFFCDYVRDLCQFICTIDHFNNNVVNTIIIDSIKSFFFEGNSLRKGGISNDAYKILNRLEILGRFLNKEIIASISPSSMNKDTVNEFLAICASCCSNIIVINSTHNVLKDTESRTSLSLLSDFIVK